MYNNPFIVYETMSPLFPSVFKRLPQRISLLYCGSFVMPVPKTKHHPTLQHPYYHPSSIAGQSITKVTIVFHISFEISSKQCMHRFFDEPLLIKAPLHEFLL